MDCIHLALERDPCRAHANTAINASQQGYDSAKLFMGRAMGSSGSKQAMGVGSILGKGNDYYVCHRIQQVGLSGDYLFM